MTHLKENKMADTHSKKNNKPTR